MTHPFVFDSDSNRFRDWRDGERRALVAKNNPRSKRKFLSIVAPKMSKKCNWKGTESPLSREPELCSAKMTAG
jgi:hypothetical protein